MPVAHATRAPTCLADALRLAQDADWSAAAVAPMLDVLPHWASELAAADRIHWQIGLRGFWSRHGGCLSGHRQNALKALAYAWDDWPLVVRIGETLVRHGGLADRGQLVMAQAHWHRGDTDAALRILQRQLIRAPRDEPAYALYGAIHDWCEWRCGAGYTECAQLSDDAIRLEPMGEHHLIDFAWQ